MIEIIKTKARYMVSIETHMVVLWWRNSNTKDNFIDSKMCVHVFLEISHHRTVTMHSGVQQWITRSSLEVKHQTH